MAKKGIFYNSNAAKVFKKAKRIICRTADDGLIYLSDGCCLYLVTKYDFDSIFRSTIQFDPGNWIIGSDGKRELRDNEFDLLKIAKEFIDSLGMTNDTMCKVFPGLIQPNGSLGKQPDTRAVYNPHSKTVAFCQAQYLDGIILDSCDVHSIGSKNVIAFSSADNIVGFVLPAILSNQERYTKSVQAFFSEE